MKLSVPYYPVKALIFFFFILSVTLADCKKNDNYPELYKYEIPDQLDDGWITESLSDAGIDEKVLSKLMDRLYATPEHNIHSILLIKKSKLVFEEYFSGEKFKLGKYTGESGFTRDDLHTLCSATKSFTSALLGIAIDKGLIKSVDEKVFNFFPENSDLIATTPGKGNLTIRHLLTMTSGLQWDDESTSYYDPANDMYKLFTSSDPMRFILSKQLINTPGTVFRYANCNTNLIGEIVHRATNRRLDIFCDSVLFSRLGISSYEWQKIKPEIIFTSGDLMLRPRDMAKFGQLFLNKGAWYGEQLISEAWCTESTSMHIDPNDFSTVYRWSDGYGFQWWQRDYTSGRKSYNSYFASGWGGQLIIVIPELETVIVFTGGNYYTGEKISCYTVVEDYIIPASTD
ncbi:MAG: serine hydrolase [Bacteroidales bacterium]|nr:serine hydrolase [Bacteroidales bacterium]